MHVNADYPSRVGKVPLHILGGLAYLMNMTKLPEKAFEPVRRAHAVDAHVAEGD